MGQRQDRHAEQPHAQIAREQLKVAVGLALRLSSRVAETARDLTPAQALARYDRRVLRFRRDAPLCDLIAAGGPSPSARLGMTRIHSCHEVRRLVLLRYSSRLP